TMSYTNQTDSRYKFTEKERDLGTNYDYFGARYYDSELGRWLSVDPLASKYPGWVLIITVRIIR
ncbi:MAG TPA: RHS repeat-associated core domain-containing protein, partial [Ignavibacteriales bacterium]|nr:RHS repeat-associated core domain-containing protein [Ignavibacteriales bacterium]